MNVIIDMTNPLAHAYNLALQYFDKPIVANAEKMFILESANYTSTVFKNTLGAGAMSTNNAYPYGWQSFANFWGFRYWLKPWKLYTDSAGSYLVFPSFTAGLFFLCQYLQQTGNNPGEWNSTDPEAEATYNTEVAQIQNIYVV